MGVGIRQLRIFRGLRRLQGVEEVLDDGVPFSREQIWTSLKLDWRGENEWKKDRYRT